MQALHPERAFGTRVVGLLYAVCEMNVKHFRWLFLPVVIALIYLANTLTFSIGSSQSCADGRCHFEGGTDPKAIFCAVGIILLYIAFLFSPPAKPGAPMPGLLRRFVAFWLDFILFMAATTPLEGIAPTLMEWKRTGIFAWHFSRDVSAPYDGWLSMMLVLETFILMALYFALPLVRARPSPGSCIMGYQIVSDDGCGLSPVEALKRVFFGFIAVCAAYFVAFTRRDRNNGKFWLDLDFGTHAVTLR